ncbi:transcriptional regulator, CdaR family [Cryobacterium psychrotolerans]|uniref:Transcriptional regulator, CdaR family n=1 Tax=Cryobacterium psychrotolerans TaxID=386301 RepID=A0A1G9GZR3_9MICO|nr:MULTISPECIES: helix-turn-helix domain-containing protein [Cryobacterium]TFD48501.1 PucR family transcriptional regulator [Cryobacterium sp. TMT1-2-1]TFD86709.1 PucR family transcriptional regulator [Cryobacterium psychrotolerans]SDL06156.1 transcriptional regulator, CdaR family [Cryobacterium psychrotolerans]
MQPATADPHDSPGLTVTELLQILDGSGLRLASRHTQRRLPLASPTLFDPWTPPTGPRTGILLGIGLHPSAPASTDAVRDAARQGFGAVVVKALSLSVETLAAVADAEGIALLVTDDEIEWRQLDALITSALTTVAEADTSLSAAPVGDLFALANAIAAMTGGATAIEDLQERVLAYSTLPGQPIDRDRQEGILGRQVPDLPENAEQYASIFRSGGAVRIDGVPPALPRLAVAVRAGSQALGSIWVVDAGGQLDSDAERALERAADIAALHLLRARSAADLARQQRAELLRRLLEGGEDSSLVFGQLGLDQAGPFVVVAFQLEFASDGGDEVRMVRLVDLIALHSAAHQHGAECVAIGDTVYVLFTGTAATFPGGVESMARRLVSRAAALRAIVRAAIGSPVTSVGAISRSRHDADLVLLLLAAEPRSTSTSVASVHDVRSRVTLLELGRVLRDSPRLVSPQARQVLDLDSRSGTDYANTLRTYLDCARDSAQAAARLSVHQNTLRYRLRRATELFGIDLASPDDTLTLWLSLRVAEFD